MFKVQFHETEICTVQVTTIDIGRGCWSMVQGDEGNYTFTFEGFDGEDRITLFINPRRGEDWEAVMVFQRPDAPMVMCRVTCVGLDVLAAQVNSTLQSWENF